MNCGRGDAQLDLCVKYFCGRPEIELLAQCIPKYLIFTHFVGIFGDWINVMPQIKHNRSHASLRFWTLYIVA